MPILVGLLMGVACATPMLYALHEAVRPSGRMNMGLLLACGLVPFMVLQAVLVVVWALWPTAVVRFGVTAVLALLTVVSVGVLRNWRHFG